MRIPASVCGGSTSAIVRVVVIAVAGWLTLLPPAVAAGVVATEETTPLAVRKVALFQLILRDPSNLDITFAYANVAAALGDNESAVAALERILLFNPNLPRVDLELGALYFRMGSFEAARFYFLEAKSFDPPPEVVARVDDYLARIDAYTSNLFLVDPQVRF